LKEKEFIVFEDVNELCHDGEFNSGFTFGYGTVKNTIREGLEKDPASTLSMVIGWMIYPDDLESLIEMNTDMGKEPCL
jgi:hypothetical protein